MFERVVIIAATAALIAAYALVLVGAVEVLSHLHQTVTITGVPACPTGQHWQQRAIPQGSVVVYCGP